MKLWFWLRVDYPEMFFGDFFWWLQQYAISFLTFFIFWQEFFAAMSELFANFVCTNTSGRIWKQRATERLVKRLLPWLALGFATFFFWQLLIEAKRGCPLLLKVTCMEKKNKRSYVSLTASGCTVQSRGRQRLDLNFHAWPTINNY